MLSEYLFVYDDRDGSFPIRLRVIKEGDHFPIPDLAELTGTVNKGDVEDLRTQLKQKYPEPGYKIASAYGNRWKAVERNWAGLDYEYDFLESHQKAVTNSKSEGVADDKGSVLIETSASRKTKVFFLAGTLFFFSVIIVLWPDFTARYGGFYSWFLTLIYNPLYALPGLIVPVGLIAGVVTFFRFVYYLRVKVKVYEHGIHLQPGNRFVRWNEVEHLWYARRRWQSYGLPLPVRQSLSLQISGERPVKLPHRFSMMEHLTSLVCRHVEPLLLEKAIQQVRQEGRVSFGKQIIITSENLVLHRLGVSIPLNQIDRIHIHGNTLQIFNLDNRVIFSSTAELIPDATILPELLDAIKN